MILDFCAYMRYDLCVPPLTGAKSRCNPTQFRQQTRCLFGVGLFFTEVQNGRSKYGKKRKQMAIPV